MTKLNKKLLPALSLLLIAALLLGGAAAFADYTAPEYEWPFIKKVPMKPKYTEDVEHHGTVETLRYTTHAYAIEAVAAGDVLSAEDYNPDIMPLDKDALCGDQTKFVMEKVPTQGSNPGLLHCRQTLYRLSYQGNLEGILQSARFMLHVTLTLHTFTWGNR